MLGVAAVMISLVLVVFVTLNIQSWILVSMGSFERPQVLASAWRGYLVWFLCDFFLPLLQSSAGSGRKIVVTRKAKDN
ncbi:hypothetical protein OIU76_011371 [Salix suchowensis]|uniref:Uncharacterized protein n=1 Tax=Salix suchowensis TaxID=1278906 RepID=A0ABQ9BAF3_9ROSI|nr:hypothetical protein OIU76_011371 [Salix suchowensis]KAJ6376004.1 hypothetical protein OIU77_000888 [Salix suchowensis]